MFLPLTERVIQRLPDIHAIKNLRLFKSLGFIEFTYDEKEFRVEGEFTSHIDFQEVKKVLTKVIVFEREGMLLKETPHTKKLEKILNKEVKYV